MIAPTFAKPPDFVGNSLGVVGDFRNEDNVGAPGNAGGQCDMPRIPAHDFKDHHPLMAGRRRLQAVKRIDGGPDSGVETDRVIGSGDVVIDGFRNPGEGKTALFRQPVEDFHAAVAADADQGIEAQQPDALQAFIRSILDRAVFLGKGERITLIDGAENGTAHTQDIAGEQLQRQFFGQRRTLHQAMGAFTDADHFPTVFLNGPEGDGADGRVESGAIATAGHHANTFNGCFRHIRLVDLSIDAI